jgi:hypothetical protein
MVITTVLQNTTLATVSITLTTLCVMLLPLMFIFSWDLEQKTDGARVVVRHKHNAGTYQKVNATVYKSIGWRLKLYRGCRSMPTHGVYIYTQQGINMYSADCA